jgi:hypothetical protein
MAILNYNAIVTFGLGRTLDPILSQFNPFSVPPDIPANWLISQAGSSVSQQATAYKLDFAS